MYQTGVVNRFEPGQELRRDLARLVELEGRALAQHLGQGLPVDVLHRHQLAAVHFFQLENPAHVRGDHLARGAHLLTQGLESTLVLEQARMQRLERHVDAELEVEGAPHLAHPSPAEAGADLIAIAEHLAGAELGGARIDGGSLGVVLGANLVVQRRLLDGQACQTREAHPTRPRL